ncbi:MAG TPA: hypothetical protein VEI50_06545 [Nitrospiraceae bacterium]|nr:hypothetical protein [Nitrospiraceae bacterium]
MIRQAKLTRHDVPRRASVLSARLSEEKLAEVRRMSPAQRLTLALELSDTCHELQRACSPKR